MFTLQLIKFNNSQHDVMYHHGMGGPPQRQLQVSFVSLNVAHTHMLSRFLSVLQNHVLLPPWKNYYRNDNNPNEKVYEKQIKQISQAIEPSTKQEVEANKHYNKFS